MKKRIRQNVWGNWKGYIGNRKVADFGNDEAEARRWLGTRTDFPPSQKECFPLRPEHIESEWSEASSDDGYWISLATGWKWAGDPVGVVHCIHEPTKKLAHKELVMRCTCGGCRATTLKLASQ